MGITVNGDTIAPEAIEYELARLVQFYAQHMPEEQVRAQLDILKERAKEQAIGAKLLLDHAVKLDLVVTDEMLDAKLGEMIESAGGRPGFEALLAKQNLSEVEVRESLKQGCRVDLLVAKVTENISDPTEEEIRAHFDAHSEEYATAERASARHILIKSDMSNEAESAIARSRIEKIREDIAGGANFGDLAKQHSDCPSGKSAGGDLGWFSPGMMVPEFDAAVFSMNVNELSEIIETSFGLHIIQKTGVQEAQPADYDTAREKVREFLRHAARGEALKNFVAELREKAEIVED